MPLKSVFCVVPLGLKGAPVVPRMHWFKNEEILLCWRQCLALHLMVDFAFFELFVEIRVKPLKLSSAITGILAFEQIFSGAPRSLAVFEIQKINDVNQNAL